MKTILAIAILVLPVMAHAMTWGELEAEIRSVEAGNAGNPVMMQRMSDIVSALVAYRRALREAQAEELLFCPQPGGSLELDQVVSMIRQQARLDQAAVDRPVEELLLRAFAREYPC